MSKKKDEVSEVYKKLITDVQEKMNEKLKKESECNQIVQECKNVESNISLIQNKIDKFKNIKPNMVCDKCYGTIKPENYKDVLRESESEKVLLLEYLEKKIKEKDELKIVLIERTKKLDDVNVSVEKVEGFNKKIYNQEKIYSESISELRKIKRPEQSNNDLVITEKIKTLSETLAEKENLNSQDSPHQDLLDSNLENLQSLKDKFNLIKEKIKADEEKAPYYDFWTEAFGDNGIRKIVVDEIIPALNSRLEYWLQVLIDNKLEIKFDDSLNETIVKYPNNDKQLIYSVLSNGQKRRINLAVNQAFAHMMMLSHGISPNIIFLDEVTTNIDQIGVQGIYNMICELSKEKKVFVTTHDSDLLSLLYGCETISLEMKNGETKIL